MKILIELPTWLGDAVMATPAIENILSLDSHAQLTLLGSATTLAIFDYHPNMRVQIVLNKQYINLYKTAKKMGNFDMFISFRNTFRSKVLAYWVRAQNKYQFNQSKYTSKQHQVQKYHQFINQSLNLASKPDKLLIYYPTHHQSKRPNKPVLGINLGASYGSAKRWYPQEFAKVAVALAKQYNIIILGNSNELDIAAAIEQFLLKSHISNYQNLVGKTSISELIAVISGLSLLITSDSGPMHLAAALQVPTVAIFGPTQDKQTSQWMNAQSVIVKKNFACQPCMQRSCPIKDKQKHHQCMKEISATEVLLNAKTLFNEIA